MNQTTEAKDKTDNELIAEFMGWRNEMIWGKQMWLKETYIDLPKIQYSKGCEAERLRFNESWEWLMPVVEKIGQLKGNYTVSINTQKEPSLYGHECSIYDIGHAVHMLVESKNLIDCVYRTVVEFIKWYNANQPKS